MRTLAVRGSDHTRHGFVYSGAARRRPAIPYLSAGLREILSLALGLGPRSSSAAYSLFGVGIGLEWTCLPHPQRSQGGVRPGLRRNRCGWPFKKSRLSMVLRVCLGGVVALGCELPGCCRSIPPLSGRSTSTPRLCPAGHIANSVVPVPRLVGVLRSRVRSLN